MDTHLDWIVDYFQVSGVVFFSPLVAERLLMSTLNACTYLGLDSGAHPIQVLLPYIPQWGQISGLVGTCRNNCNHIFFFCIDQ